MEYRAEAADLETIRLWRDMYRLEMDCQIIHDSIHFRPGWTQEYVLSDGRVGVGYGSVAVGGPWKEEPAVYEFYVIPAQRLHIFEWFRALLEVGGASEIEVQSNDPIVTPMLHAFARDVTSLSILFRDEVTTAFAPDGAVFRSPLTDEAPDVRQEQLRWHGVVDIGGEVAATGGILFHYNPPHGDIHMDVAEPFRRRGLGSFIVQELKRVCYEGGYIPGARCNPSNLASRRTLQKAGFVPCGHVLKGRVPNV